MIYELLTLELRHTGIPQIVAINCVLRKMVKLSSFSQVLLSLVLSLNIKSSKQAIRSQNKPAEEDTEFKQTFESHSQPRPGPMVSMRRTRPCNNKVVILV